MMRLGQFSFVIFLSMLPMFATASRAASGPIVLAELQEESIPAQDLAAPGPAAAPAAAAQANPDEGTWE
ncbi:MAG: hypothetical protein WA571_07670, partial [Candidatus Binatus sp.]